MGFAGSGLATGALGCIGFVGIVCGRTAPISKVGAPVGVGWTMVAASLRLPARLSALRESNEQKRRFAAVFEQSS
jgi:hypothetical protein